MDSRLSRCPFVHCIRGGRILYSQQSVAYARFFREKDFQCAKDKKIITYIEYKTTLKNLN
jgi:hypothetical protein